jgi:hypothetical protein
LSAQQGSLLLKLLKRDCRGENPASTGRTASSAYPSSIQQDNEYQQLERGRGMFGQTGFFARRWRGEVPLQVVFWRDMLGIATFINLLASVMALILASRGSDLRIAVALHFSPIAYNLFLFTSVWRSPQCTVLKKAIAFAWLAAMTIV